jgi:hypothetical protein
MLVLPSRMPHATSILPDGKIAARRSLVTQDRSRRRADLLQIAAGAAAMLGALALAAPAAAHGVVATGSGRAGAIVAWVVALIGVVSGGVALARAAGRIGGGSGRDGAVVALALGLVGMALAGLHLATTTGGFGAGNGRAGAVVALGLGLLGVVLGRRALAAAPARLADRPGREIHGDV